MPNLNNLSTTIGTNLAFTPELELIVAILRRQLDPSCELAIATTLNWDELIKLSVRHRLIYQVAMALQSSSVSVPAQVLAQLQALLEQHQLQLLRLNAETIRIIRKLNAAAIDYIVVKGTPLAQSLYGASDQRTCKDLDLWVSPDNLLQVGLILEQLGYQRTLPDFPLDEFKHQYWLHHRHDWCYWHPKRQVEVELHFRLEYLGTNFFNIEQVPRQLVNLVHTPINCLADDYNFLYLISHGAIHAWTRLRWLHDIALFLASQRLDLPAILKLAEQLNCVPLLEQALYLVRSIYQFTTPAMENIIAARTQRGLHLSKLALQFIRADYELTHHQSMFDKMFYSYRYYLWCMAPLGRKWQVVIGDFIKLDKVFAKYSFKPRQRWLYYLVYPVWVIEYIVTRLRQP